VYKIKYEGAVLNINEEGAMYRGQRSNSKHKEGRSPV